MFWLINKCFLYYWVLVNLLQQNVSLNNETCMATPTLIDLNLVDFNYYQLMTSPHKCNGSCNAVYSCKAVIRSQ